MPRTTSEAWAAPAAQPALLALPRVAAAPACSLHGRERQRSPVGVLCEKRSGKARA